jgi:hypothetical protein
MDMRAQIAATLFQPAPGGYVYREPYRWPFGQARHYLVTADQKAALVAILVPKRPILWQTGLWMTLCLMVAIGCVGLWLWTGHDTPTALDILVLIILTVAQAVTGSAILFWWKRRRLRPLLATLTPTALRITPTELRAALMDAMSVKQLVFAGVAAVFASTAMLVNALIQLAWRQPAAVLFLAGSILFACLAWRYFAELVARTNRA